MASTSATSRRRRRAERMFKRAVRRIRRFFASYVSPLGWAVTGAGIACLIAFPFLGWYELLVFGIVAMVAMTPLITIQLVGLAFKIKTDAQKKHQKLAEPFAEEEILDLSKED